MTFLSSSPSSSSFPEEKQEQLNSTFIETKLDSSSELDFESSNIISESTFNPIESKENTSLEPSTETLSDSNKISTDFNDLSRESSNTNRNIVSEKSSEFIPESSSIIDTQQKKQSTEFIYDSSINTDVDSNLSQSNSYSNKKTSQINYSSDTENKAILSSSEITNINTEKNFDSTNVKENTNDYSSEFISDSDSEHIYRSGSKIDSSIPKTEGTINTIDTFDSSSNPTIEQSSTNVNEEPFSEGNSYSDMRTSEMNDISESKGSSDEMTSSPSYSLITEGSLITSDIK